MTITIEQLEKILDQQRPPNVKEDRKPKHYAIQVPTTLRPVENPQIKGKRRQLVEGRWLASAPWDKAGKMKRVRGLKDTIPRSQRNRALRRGGGHIEALPNAASICRCPGNAPAAAPSAKP